MKKSNLFFLSIILFSSCNNENEPSTDFSKIGLLQNLTNLFNYGLLSNEAKIKSKVTIDFE